MITWRLFPFVRIVFAFIVGILLNRWIPECNIFFFLTIIFSIGYILYVDILFPSIYYKPEVSCVLVLFLFISIGYFRSDINKPSFNISHYCNNLHDFDSGIGIVQEIPIKRTSQRTEIEILNLCNSKFKRCIEVNGKAVAYFKINDKVATNYKPGDKIYFKGRLNEVKGNTNPYSFDFKIYLFNRGITHQVYVWGDDKHKLIETNSLSFIYQSAMNVRDKFLYILKKYDNNDERFAISSAMILGYKNMVSEEMYKAFSDSGAVHILAVSGMHLGILATALAFFLDKWKSNIKGINIFKYLFVLSILWFFAFITGAAPAMLRAAIMFTIILYAKYFKPSANVFNVLAICALLMLLYDPNMIYQASFQFSFVAMLSLVYFQPYIKNWYTPTNFITKGIWELTSVAIAAQILVVPITIYFFHKFPLYFILTGVVSVWLSTVALYTGLAMFVVEYIYSPVNFLLGKLFTFLMDVFIKSVTMVKEIPFCSIDGIVLSEFELIVIYILLIMLMLYVMNKKFYLLKGIVSMICIIILTTGLRIHNANHQVMFTIYDNRNKNQIDIFDGRTVYGISFDTTTSAELNPFINLNNRIYKSVSDVKEVDRNSDFIGMNCRKRKDVLQLRNKYFCILDENNQSLILDNFDYIFITNNIQFKSNLVVKKNAVIIADRNMDQNNLNEWYNFAEGKGISFHSLKNNGSISIKV